ncbi:hypothetical protein GCM10023116_32710 [Kistimonas scapharcae]|uniref:Uncharacterized protein n=1 Tax=Kistimonas scapharcae TaxID=1036133 RepID=A0ABP8V429_9GAMM
MKPLNYALLKYFTTVDEACETDVMAALKDEYSSFKAYKKDAIISALMTAKTNGLLEETHFELDDNNELHVYYRANESGAATINQYIK